MKILPLTALALLTISGAGYTYWKAPRSEEREATRRVYRRVLERALDREHKKILRVDLFEDHSDWATAVEIPSKYYSVKTTNAMHGKNLGLALDRQLLALQQFLNTKYVPPRRFPVWILPSLEEYAALGESSDEHSSFYSSYYSNQDPGSPVISTYNLSWNRTDVLHSAVHQYVAAAFPRSRLTPWISEGLAHYFALNSTQFIRDWAAKEHPARLDRYIPLRALLQEDQLSSYGTLQQADTRLLELSLLFRFLLEECPDTASIKGADEPEASFRNYLISILNGRDLRREGFTQLFMNRRGLADLEGLFRDFRFD